VAVEKVLPSAIPPFEEVKARVEAKYRETESKKLAEKKAAEFLEVAKKSGWDAALKAAGAKSETTGAVAKKGPPPAKLAWTPELRDAAFALTTVGAIGAKAFPVQEKVYVFRLAARTPADPAGFAAQKEKLTAELLPVKQNEVLQEMLKKLKAEAKIKINDEMLM
jgi:parvulin-like peptidyl-prolyl isomerase